MEFSWFVLGILVVTTATSFVIRNIRERSIISSCRWRRRSRIRDSILRLVVMMIIPVMIRIFVMMMIVDSHRRSVWYRIDLETTKSGVGCRRRQQWNDTDLQHNDTKEVGDGGCWFHDPRIVTRCSSLMCAVLPWCVMCYVLDADPDVGSFIKASAYGICF